VCHFRRVNFDVMATASVMMLTMYRFEDDDWPPTAAPLTRSTAEGRRQRAVRRQRTEPVLDHIRASSASELHPRDDRLTPSVVEDDASEKNVDEVDGLSQSDHVPSSLDVVGEQGAGQSRRLIRRRQANGGMMTTKRATGRRDGTVSDAEPVHESVSKSVTEQVPLQSSCSRSPGVSPKSAISFDRFSQESSSSAVTLDYAEEVHRPSDRNIPDGISSDIPDGGISSDSPIEPAYTYSVAHRRVDCHSAPSLLEDGDGDRLDNEDNEDRRKTTSGVRFDGTQTAAATDPDFLVDQTSANVVIDVGATQEKVESKTGNVSETAVSLFTPGTSVIASEQEASPANDGTYSSAVESDCAAVQPLSVTDRGPSVVERSRRRSVVVPRRRHVGKPIAVLRGRSADHVVSNSSPAAVTRHAAVSPTMQNGIEPDNERQVSESTQFK